MCCLFSTFHETSSPFSCFLLEMIEILTCAYTLHPLERGQNVLKPNLNQLDIFIIITLFLFFGIKQITTFNISLVVHGTVAEKSIHVSSAIVLTVHL